MFATRKTAIAFAVATAFPLIAAAADTPLPTVTVSSNGIPTTDADATYASEVHDRKAIEASGATTLYDYLSQNTTLNVLPAFGNKQSPLIDMRGYGSENGYQNVVIVVDGQRMNNVDLATPSIGAIPAGTIERIEISKGSGSILYGDGAMAGVINITTRRETGAAASFSGGNFGAQAATLSAGLSRELFDISASSANNRFGGTSYTDSTGHADHSEARNEYARLAVRPVQGLTLFIQASDRYEDSRFVNPLTRAQFDANPRQTGGDYTQQTMTARTWRLGAEYKINDRLTAAYARNGEDKDSLFNFYRFSFSSRFAYDSRGDDLSLKYRGDSTDFITGVQSFDAERIGTTDRRTKENRAIYAQAIHRIGLLALSAGARHEDVEYRYAAFGGASSGKKTSLNAWDLGANYRFNDEMTAFVNLNRAYQAPDVDRIFDGAGVFSGFIAPARTYNFTTGFNFDLPRNKLRTAAFYSKLRDEIYFEPSVLGLGVGKNTNLDKTHKYGLEFSDTWQALDTLQLRAAYTYTRAIIDHAERATGSYTDKELPGVPHNAVTLGANWQPWANGTLTVNHVWRDSTYSFSDYNNNRAQRQAAYQVTNVSLRQRFGKVEGYVAVDNLFKHKNGIWTDDDSIYAVDFERLIRIGIKAEM